MLYVCGLRLLSAPWLTNVSLRHNLPSKVSEYHLFEEELERCHEATYWMVKSKHTPKQCLNKGNEPWPTHLTLLREQQRH